MKNLTKVSCLLFSVLVVASCRSKPLEGGARSKEELVRGFIAALTTGDNEKVRSFLVRKKEYAEAIHPHTPEAKGVEANTWWDTMIIRKRDLLTNGLIYKFKGKTCQVEITGKEKSSESHGPLTFYREIPVKIVCGDKENLYTDDTRYIFAIVVEKYGIWKLLNIFND
jgi:hypothetical protein